MSRLSADSPKPLGGSDKRPLPPPVQKVEQVGCALVGLRFMEHQTQPAWAQHRI